MRGYDLINTILPDELIIEIFNHLDGSKLIRDACSLVCKRWLNLERPSRLTVRIGASGSSPDALVVLLSRRFVNVRNVYIDQRLSNSPPLELGYSRGQASPYKRRGRGANNPARSSLKFWYTTKNSGSDGSNLDTCSLSDAGLTALGEGFTRLEKLSLIWCSDVTNVGLKSTAERCRFLKSLDLQVNI
ncbi:hypothetical protein HHK36_012552 [Tetracentron sinense]|uniref:F-box domain-containing protein n=1 Tax=Tetracentron sinense TaxID=13715 RepID=A0A834Z9E0_TETSI|nr:hypothetical protein HHK36_012552 [Tetracentron sinense]